MRRAISIAVAVVLEQFGNARWVRNLFDAAVVRQAWRLRDVASPTVEQLRVLDGTDLAQS